MKRCWKKIRQWITMLLFVSLLAGCEKAPDSGESMTGSDNLPEKTAEENTAEENIGGNSHETKPGETKEESSSSEKDSEAETEESPTESEMETENQPKPYQKPAQTPEGWETFSSASRLFRVLEDSGVVSGKLEKTEMMNGINVWKASFPKESEDIGEACYYQTSEGMQMVYRDSDGSGIVMTLHGSGGASFLLKAEVEPNTDIDRSTFPRSIRMEEDSIAENLFSFYTYISYEQIKLKMTHSPDSFSMKGVRRSDEGRIESLCEGFWSSHSNILKEMNSTWYAIGFPKLDHDPYWDSSMFLIELRDSAYDRAAYDSFVDVPRIE